MSIELLYIESVLYLPACLSGLALFWLSRCCCITTHSCSGQMTQDAENGSSATSGRSCFLHHHFPMHLATNGTFFFPSPSQRGKELGFWLGSHVFSHEIRPLMKTRDDFGSRWLEKHWFSEAITTIPRVLNGVWDICPTSSWCFYSLCMQPPLFKVVLAEARMLLYLAQWHSTLFLLSINYLTHRLWVLCVHLRLYNNHLEICISTKRLKKVNPQTNENLNLSLSEMNETPTTTIYKLGLNYHVQLRAFVMPEC